jgi:hypothetical protein
MLQLAAKAAGLEWFSAAKAGLLVDKAGDWKIWNPLTDDGDALRLAVYLKMTIKVVDNAVDVSYVPGDGSVACFTEYFAEGVETAKAATRRAITGLAAEIGKRAQ